jgi:ribosome-associated translation inhibitor RaiA
MNLSVQYKCDDFRPQIEQDIARYAGKMDRWLERYDPDAISLHACYEKNSRKHTYIVTLNLKLPSATLHASASNNEARFALRRAFDEMELQVNKRQRLSRKDYEWKRKRLRRPVSVEA